MIVKSDQDRVRALLTEAITVLCKKKLTFKSQLSIEGLIGITLDANDIFLISIKEILLQQQDEAANITEDVVLPEDSPVVVKTEMNTSKPVAMRSSSDSGSTCSTNGSRSARSGRQRKSTPRHLSVVSPSLQYDISNPNEEEEEEECWLLQDGTDIDNLHPVSHISNDYSATTINTHSAIINGNANNSNNNNNNNNNNIPAHVLENGHDAPLNLSNPASKRRCVDIVDKPHRDISPQKRKRHDSGDTNSECSSTFSGSIKRPSSVSNISSLSPSRTATPPTLDLSSIKQEPSLEPHFNNNHHLHNFDSQTNGFYTHPPGHHEKPESICTAYSNGIMKDTGNILAGRTSLLESAIWQRLASPITPLQLNSPIIPSQEVTKLVENGEMLHHTNGSDDTREQPVLKVPLYSITGKIKKEKKTTANTAVPEKMPIKEATNTTVIKNTIEKMLNSKENGSSNNNSVQDLVLDYEKKHLMKKMEVVTKAVSSKGSSVGSDSSDRLESSYSTDTISQSDSILDHSDGYHSFQTDSTDQENIEVFSVDSDDDVKTEDFIDRSQEPGKAVTYRCKLCDRVYSNKWNCRRHIQYTHMNKTGFTCEICHNKYRDRSDYNEHLQVIHQGPGGYKCDFCDKILMSKRSLKEHVSLHTGQYRYHCIECSRGFNRLNDYQLHMTKDHGANLATVTSAEMVQILENSHQKLTVEAEEA